MRISLMKVVVEKSDIYGKDRKKSLNSFMTKVKTKYDEKEEQFGSEQMREFEKVIVLREVDTKWMDHIDAMDQLRQGIHLRAYGQTMTRSASIRLKALQCLKP